MNVKPPEDLLGSPFGNKSDAPCMFCGITEGVYMRKVYGMDIYRVAACNLCAQYIPDREMWVLTLYGGTCMMNRVEALERQLGTMSSSVNKLINRTSTHE